MKVAKKRSYLKQPRKGSKLYWDSNLRLSQVSKLVNIHLASGVLDSSRLVNRENHDWRSSKAVPSPRDQKDYSTCVSFSAVTVIETLHYIKHKERITLAPGYIHTCLMGKPNDVGVDTEQALTAILDGGIAYGAANDYPYPKAQCKTAKIYKIKNVNWIEGENSAMSAIANVGPIIGEMLVDKVGFESNYQKGEIYKYEALSKGYVHAVAVIGFDFQNKYWIISNSRGSSWGEDGFGYVAFGSGGLLTTLRGGWQITI